MNVCSRISGTGAAAAVLLVATGAGAALASRTPTKSERSAIVRAVHASPDIAIPDNSYDVRGIRISTVAGYRRYGRVRIVPKGGQGDNALGLVRRRNGAWKLVNLGTSGVGCNLPAAVQRDLRIDDC